MKKVIFTSAVVIALTVAGVRQALAITEAQSYVVDAMESLKMTLVPSKVVGGPQKYKITKATLDMLKKAMDQGKVIVVENDGSIKVQ